MRFVIAYLYNTKLFYIILRSSYIKSNGTANSVSFYGYINAMFNSVLLLHWLGKEFR